MKQQDALGPMLGRAAQLTRACMDARLSRYGVTPAQTRVLMYLHRRGGQAPQRELTDYLEVRPSTANGILDRLEEKGLVVRSVSREDGRQKLLTLVEGQRQQELFTGVFREMEALLAGSLSEEEQATLRALLGRVILNLEEDRTE